MNSPEFMNGRTKAYNDISLNITYLSSMFKRDFIIHMNITNLLGFDNVFGYQYASVPDETGSYPSQAIVPTCVTQVILMFMLSL